jgi:hypothetical protein
MISRYDVLFLKDPSFERWDFEATRGDPFCGQRQNADFGELAIVAGSAWVKWGGFFIKGESRVFPRQPIDAAWQWISGRIRYTSLTLRNHHRYLPVRGSNERNILKV